MDGMEVFAKKLLERLLAAGERAGRPGASGRTSGLEAKSLERYRQVKSLAEKEAFERVMKAAEIDGGIRLLGDREGFISRIDLANVGKLAGTLGVTLNSTLVEDARSTLASYLDEFPVLEQVLAQWKALKSVRGLGPKDSVGWADAAVAIRHLRTWGAKEAMPLREASVRIFRDSKRLECIAAQIDVLLLGNLEESPRLPADIWHELDLYKEEQPVLLAGAISIRRERGTMVLDIPYSGLRSTTVLGVDVKATPVLQVISIENLTTFHSEARRRAYEPVLILYTGGMPSPSWGQMYQRLLRSLPLGTAVLHWGDIDEGGFRIASRIGRYAMEAGFHLGAMNMSPRSVPEKMRRPAPAGIVERMVRYAHQAGWEALAMELQEAGIICEQEAL